MNFGLGLDEDGHLPIVNGIDLPAAVANRTGATMRKDHVQVSVLDTCIHEIGHDIGQIGALFKYFRDDKGESRTPRDSSGQPVISNQKCADGIVTSGRHASEDTVKVVQVGGRFEQYVVTPRVQAMARNKFDCHTLVGARTSRVLGVYWIPLARKTNLMSSIVADANGNILSRVTLAPMEDSGWYWVDYRGTLEQSFGIKAGCEFVEQGCIDKTTGKKPSWVEN